MKDLKVYKKVILTKRNRRVVLRTPQKGDVDGLLRFINELVDEETFILLDKRVTRKEEIAYLDERLRVMREKRGFNLVAVYRGRIVANGNINKHIGRETHVGDLGISVVKDFRDEGLGTVFIKEMLGLAKERLGLKIVTLTVFENNERARHFYRKISFVECGRTPKGVYYKGEYVDSVMMCLDLSHKISRSARSAI